MRPRVANFSWLFGAGHREKPSLLQWPGCVPCSMSQLVSFAVGRLRRAERIGLESGAVALHVLLVVLELLLLGYPPDVVRTLVHRLPRGGASLLVQRVVRRHLAGAMACRNSGAAGRGSKEQSGKRRHRPSDSWSPSPSRRRSSQVKSRAYERARSPGYEAYLAAKEKEAKEESLREQSAALREVLDSKFSSFSNTLAGVAPSMGQSAASSMAPPSGTWPEQLQQH